MNSVVVIMEEEGREMTDTRDNIEREKEIIPDTELEAEIENARYPLDPQTAMQERYIHLRRIKDLEILVGRLTSENRGLANFACEKEQEAKRLTAEVAACACGPWVEGEPPKDKKEYSVWCGDQLDVLHWDGTNCYRDKHGQHCWLITHHAVINPPVCNKCNIIEE